MTFERKLLAAMLTTVAMAAPTAAWAAYDQSVQLTGIGADAIQSSQLSFTSSSGQTVPVKKDDDDDGFFIIGFGGNSGESGTLTYPGPDGQPRSVFIPAARPGEIVSVDIGSGAVSTGPRAPNNLTNPVTSRLPPFLRGPSVTLDGGFRTFKVPRAGVGVTNIGDPSGEEFIQHIGGRIDFFSYGADVLIPTGPVVIGFGYHGGSGNNRERGQVEVGGVDTGVVFNGESGEFGTDILSLRARRTDTMLNISPNYKATKNFVGLDARYYWSSGTSFSAPLVTAAASLLLSKNPDLKAKDLRRLLKYGARDIESPGVDRFTGYGLLDAAASLAADPRSFIEAHIANVGVGQANGGPAALVAGSADAFNMRSAVIEIGKGESPTQWKKVADVSAPVENGQLAAIPAQNFTGGGTWIVRLVITDGAGKSREARYKVTLG